MSEEEIFKFLRENVSDEIMEHKVEIKKSERNNSIIITEGLTSETILRAMGNLDFKETKKLVLKNPLYCRAIRSITPIKPNPTSDQEDPALELSTNKSTPQSLAQKSNTGTLPRGPC